MYDMNCIRKTMDNLKKNNMDAVFLESKKRSTQAAVSILERR